MRRTPLVGLLALILLGFSGCASDSRRLDWSSPATAGPDPAETPTAIKFSWWRLPRAEAPWTDSAGNLAAFNRAESPAVSTKVPGDVWPEPKSDWQARYFPHLSRLWNGSATGQAPEAEPGSDMLRVSSLSRPPAAPRARRADDGVRPVDASAADDIASRDSTAVAEQHERFVPPLVPTPLLVPSRDNFPPEANSDVELDISKIDLGREGRARAIRRETAVEERQRAAPSSVASTPVIATVTGEVSPSAPPPAPAETLTATEPVSASAPIVNPEPELEPELELTQAPAPAPAAPSAQPPAAIPPAPPLNRTPPPPPLIDDKPAVKPDQPEPPTVPKPADEAKPGQPPETTPQPAPVVPAAEFPEILASPAPSAPPPAAAAAAAVPKTQPSVPASGQRTASASGQAVYASPPPMAPPHPRKRFLSLFFVEDKKVVPLASPQFPPAMFPTTYYGTYPRPYPVLAAPQASVAKPPVAAKTTKKPCVLTAWFQRLTIGGHGSCCTGCHHVRPTPCCSGCTCHAGSNPPVEASPQRSLPSPQGNPPSRQGPLSEMTPIDSTRPKPGDVTEEGKLFERVSFESFDKSPQS